MRPSLKILGTPHLNDEELKLLSALCKLDWKPSGSALARKLEIPPSTAYSWIKRLLADERLELTLTLNGFTPEELQAIIAAEDRIYSNCVDCGRRLRHSDSIASGVCGVCFMSLSKDGVSRGG